MTHEWVFPLPRVYTGILVGNGRLGALVWGQGNLLHLSLGRSDLWDHRGGMPWTPEQSYRAIRDCLEKGDQVRLRALFEKTAEKPGEPARPTVLPLGRIDLRLPAGANLRRALLDTRTGVLALEMDGDGCSGVARLTAHPTADYLALEWPTALDDPRYELQPSWKWLGEKLAGLGYEPAEYFEDDHGAGWVQRLPADPSVAVLLQKAGRVFWIATARGRNADHAIEHVHQVCAEGMQGGTEGVRRDAGDWWRAYWETVPHLALPNPRLQFLYDYGMFKFGMFTNPEGVPATLQGPWLDETRVPPWSNDYHFNINVQMCYWPAYAGNRLENLVPLFRMIEKWIPSLRWNARCFVGIEDGLMLPHAVDDQGTCMGGFWSGSIDHQCTGWVAQMMYQYYRFTQDKRFLRRLAYPFLKGAMRVYEALLEETNGQYALPVSVSPEYKGSAMDAWGRNASTQLACIHMLLAALRDTCTALGEPYESRWEDIARHLPKATVGEAFGEKHILLWEGQDLAESHRHHSHLAGITPFDVLDYHDPAWRGVIDGSFNQWVRMGSGYWSGWCMPWAAMIHLRLGNADMAEQLLETWQTVFTNEGHGTLHDVGVRGYSLIGQARMRSPDRAEIMQMDAGMACTSAILEMMLYAYRGVHYVFGGASRRWRDASFRDIRADGGFLVSGALRAGRVACVELRSLFGGVFRLQNPWGVAARLVRNGRTSVVAGEQLEIAAVRDESIAILPAVA